MGLLVGLTVSSQHVLDPMSSMFVPGLICHKTTKGYGDDGKFERRARPDGSVSAE